MTVNTLRHLEERMPRSVSSETVQRPDQPRRLLSLLYSLPHGDLGLDCPQLCCWGLSGPDLPLIDWCGVFGKGGWHPLTQVRAALGSHGAPLPGYCTWVFTMRPAPRLLEELLIWGGRES